jgi:tol-pal system protein YbgF
MLALLIQRKGLLLKSFFICALTSSVSAKTLIFQSSDVSSQPELAEPRKDKPVNTGASSAPPKTSLPAPSVNSELFFLVEQLKQEVMMLRGIVEEKDYEIRQMQKLSKERYRDIDQRLQDLSKKLANAGIDSRDGLVTQSASVANQPPSEATGVVIPVGLGGEVVPVQTPKRAGGAVKETEEQKVAYQNAYNYVRDKNFPEAIEALHAYVEKYPEGDLTGNAFYWLGEVYLVLPKLEQAKQAFSIVVKTFPGHRKLPDAMYKLAVTLDRLQDPASAEQYLKQVQQKFPNSTAAKLAENYTISR